MTVARSSGGPNPRELDVITHQIHDLWFEVSEVHFDRAAGTLTIPFVARNQPRATAGFEDRWLCIRGVRSVRLEETEGVGRYDFNEFRFAPETGILQLATGIPLRFDVSVTELDISVQSSEENALA